MEESDLPRGRGRIVYEPADTLTVKVGTWSRKGAFLGVVGIPTGSGAEAPVHSCLSTSRDPGEGGTTFTAHRFPGGYRVRVRGWWDGGEQMLWLAPVEEGEESYMGLFSEEELRAAFPRLAAPDTGWEERG